MNAMKGWQSRSRESFDGWRDAAVHCGREKVAATSDPMRWRGNVWVDARVDARVDAERAVGVEVVRVGRCLVYGVLVSVPASPPAISPFASGAGGS